MEVWTKEKQLNYVIRNEFCKHVMSNIEDLRKKRLKEYKASGGTDNRYTQQYMAYKGGISLSTYKNYLTGDSYDIKLITILKFADILRCEWHDILPVDQY